jgi:uncharacterized protein (TIGR03435 family)
MSVIRLSVAALLAAAPVFPQSNPARPQFEVASIKPSAGQIPNQAGIGLHIDGAQVRCNYLPLREYLVMAYQVKPNQIVGPDWIATERFDVAAKIPENGHREQIREMIQMLLEDRFQLKAHRDKKDFPVYGLTLAKGGLKIKPLPPDPEDANRRAVDMTASGSAAGVNVAFGNGASFSLTPGKFQIKKLSLQQFADVLSRFADRPVVDMTETPGNFDFNVDITPEDYRALLVRSAVNNGVSLPPEALRALEGVSGDSLFMSLQTVGLKMETRKAPLDVLVVDSIAKTPTEN